MVEQETTLLQVVLQLTQSAVERVMTLSLALAATTLLTVRLEMTLLQLLLLVITPLLVELEMTLLISEEH